MNTTYKSLGGESEVKPGYGLVNENSDFTHVLSLWLVGTCLQCERLTAGRNNDSFHVKTETGDYVLRRSHASKTSESLAFEHALIDCLRTQGLPAPELIRSKAGLTWESCDGRLWTVSRFIVGEQPVSSEPTASMAGAIMARFHSAMLDFKPVAAVPPEANRITEVSSILASCKSDPALTTEVSNLIARTNKVAQLTVELLQVSAQNLQRTIIHGGCRLTSLLLKDSRIAALLDMDSARCGTRAEDIAIALASFAKCRDGTAAVDAIMVRSFCKGYESILKIESAEARVIPGYLAQALLFPWAKAMERSLATKPYDAEQLAKAQWRLVMAEQVVKNPQSVIELLPTN